MNQDDKDLFAAQTQRHVTFILLYSLVGLIGGLLIAAFLPFQANDKVIAIVNPLVTGVLSLASGAVGFWIARTRPNNGQSDGDSKK
jgi:uncharacterized protein YacL